jgi:hypothetical protein
MPMARSLLLLAALAFAAHVCAQAPSLAEYVYTPPAGWTVTPYPDGVVMTSPVSNTGEKCVLSLWPLRPGSNDLQRDAGNAFAEAFKAFEARTSEYATPASMARGVSAHGWDYLIVKRAIGIPGQPTVSGFGFVARLGGWVAPVSGISKDPLVSSCFGLMVKDAWPKFFYSLQFRSWKPAAGSAPLAAKVPGVWMAVSATAGDRYVFAANGRYASAAAAQRYVRISSTELLRVTDAYFGDGAYRLKGHQIVLTPDGKTGTENGLLRVQQESSDGGRTWADKLYLLRKSAVDGAEYEVAYTRQN